MAENDSHELPGDDALYDEAACGLLVTDAAGTILKANLTFCRWLGVQREQVYGIRFQDLLSVGGRIFHQTHWTPLLQMQGSIAEVKLDLHKAQGQPIPVVVNAVRRERAGRVLHELALFVAEDRHAYESELMRARKQAEQFLAAQQAAQQAAQDRALLAEQMIGIVSHDLRNPLSTILLGAASLESVEMAPRHKLFLDSITESARRAQRLVGDLLDFTMARLGQGIGVNCQPMDLHVVVAKCVEELARTHPQRMLRHVAQGAGKCMADEHRLFQVTSNLVGNAVAYGDPEAPIVVTSQGGGGTCSLSVHNEGAPIPPQLLPTLFQAMVRGSEESSSARNVGLGLYIVSEIARAHGGNVEVTSSADKGTTFTFTFPAGSCAEDSQRATPG